MNKEEKNKRLISKNRVATNGFIKNDAGSFFHLTSREYILLYTCLIITLLCYLPAFTNGWTAWDDNYYVYQNELTTHLSLSSLPDFFTSWYLGNYHPFTMLSLAMDYSLSHNNATWFHTHSILLHLVNVALVFLFAWSLTRKQWAAAVTALFFGIHPEHIESVAWISERKDLLYVLYYLAGLITYIRYIQSSERTKYYVITLALFIFSCLSKGQAVTFPVTLLLIDYYLQRRFDKKLWLEKIPFFVLAVAFGVVAIVAQKSANAIHMTETYSFFERIILAGYALFTYFYKVLLPFNLSALYPFPLKVNGYLDWSVFITAIAAIVLLGTSFYYIKRSRIVAFGFLFFLANVLLILQLLPLGSAIMADRYTYLSYIGLFIIMGMGVQQLMDTSSKRLAWMKGPVLMLTLIFAIFFSLKTYSRVPIWKSSETVFLDMYHNNENIPQVLDNLGSIYTEQGKTELALKYLRRGEFIDPYNKDTYGNLGILFDRNMQFDSAIANYQKVLFIDAKDANAYKHLGIDYMNKGMIDEAIKNFTLAIKFDPDKPGGYELRSHAYNDAGKTNQALSDIHKAISIGSYDKAYMSQLYTGLGDIYNTLKQYASCDSSYNLAFHLDPDNIGALNAYAFYLAERNEKLERAAALIQKVVNEAPDEPDYMDTYGWVLYKLHRYEEAKTWIEKSLKNGDGNNASVMEHYGDALYKTGDTAAALQYWQKAKDNNVKSETIDKKIKDKGIR